MFQGLNDWKIVETFATKNNDRDSEKVKRTILRKRRSDMSGLIKMGETAAYAVEDTNENGFYLVKWTSEPYADQETKQLMCKGLWYETFPKCTDIYYVMDREVAVRVQYVLATGILMPRVRDKKEFPRNAGKAKDKQGFIDRGAFKISASDLEDIHQEIRRRDTLDYVEESNEEETAEETDDKSGDESNC